MLINKLNCDRVTAVNGAPVLWRRQMSLLACLVLAAFVPVGAQTIVADPLITDRPDFTESTATVSPGRYQLELGYTFARHDDYREHSAGELLLRTGVARGVEVRLGLNSYRWLQSGPQTVSGLEDAVLGFKFSLADGREGAGAFQHPAVGLILSSSVPTGNNAFGENSLQPETVLAFAVAPSDRLSLAANINYGYPAENGQRFHQVAGSLSLGLALAENTGAYVEFFGFTPASRNGPDNGYVNGGLTFLLQENFQIDVRAGAGIGAQSADFFLGAGSALRL